MFRATWSFVLYDGTHEGQIYQQIEQMNLSIVRIPNGVPHSGKAVT